MVCRLCEKELDSLGRPIPKGIETNNIYKCNACNFAMCEHCHNDIMVELVLKGFGGDSSVTKKLDKIE